MARTEEQQDPQKMLEEMCVDSAEESGDGLERKGLKEDTVHGESERERERESMRASVRGSEGARERGSEGGIERERERERERKRDYYLELCFRNKGGRAMSF